MTGPSYGRISGIGYCGYVCNAAVAPSIRDDAHNPASCFGKEGRRRIEQAQKGRSEPGFSRSNSHPIPGNELHGSGQQGASVRADPDAKCGAAFSDLEPFDLPGENISDASLGLDHLRRARVVLQFAAQAENLDVDAAIEHVFVDSSRL